MSRKFLLAAGALVSIGVVVALPFWVRQRRAAVPVQPQCAACRAALSLRIHTEIPVRSEDVRVRGLPAECVFEPDNPYACSVHHLAPGAYDIEVEATGHEPATGHFELARFTAPCACDSADVELRLKSSAARPEPGPRAFYCMSAEVSSGRLCFESKRRCNTRWPHGGYRECFATNTAFCFSRTRLDRSDAFCMPTREECLRAARSLPDHATASAFCIAARYDQVWSSHPAPSAGSLDRDPH